MSTPYLVLSDIHLHSWSAFSTVSNEGVNSRLQQLLDAISEAARHLLYAGGNHIFIAGDVFHKRGSIEPAVLNPALDLFKRLVDVGFKVYVIPGNHDMTANDSQRVGNAVTALESVGVVVAHEPMVVSLRDDHKVALFPWYSSVKTLLEEMSNLREELVEDTIEDDAEPWLDAIIHAPIDGVLPHLPAHGLDAHALEGVGFNRVFSGHYHNHKCMAEGIYSIGALTHQSWGDIGSVAGYLLVGEEDEEAVVHFTTSHPLFAELTGEETDEEAAAKCAGNYVRVRCEITDDSELKSIRDGVLAMGAKGVTVMPVRNRTVTRAGSTSASSSGTLEDSIKKYVGDKGYVAVIHNLALDILNEARST